MFVLPTCVDLWLPRRTVHRGKGGVRVCVCVCVCVCVWGASLLSSSYPIYLPIHLYLEFCVCLSVCLPVSLCPSLSVCLIYLSVCLCLSVLCGLFSASIIYLKGSTINATGQHLVGQCAQRPPINRHAVCLSL